VIDPAKRDLLVTQDGISGGWDGLISTIGERDGKTPQAQKRNASCGIAELLYDISTTQTNRQ
jgi:hypothetical protein